MDKRYQVFVSSTYADLREERQAVTKALMQMDCIPAGMELFPAIDDEQFEFIKRIIDDCDYYLLIIGNRYGSLTEAGISYTEREYDYACEIGLKVLAFVHESPEKLSVEKSDTAPDLQEKLEAFRARVMAGRLVRQWSESAALPGEVALSLMQTIKAYPATGWVRADQVANSEILAEVNDLRKNLAKLKSESASRTVQNEIGVSNLASLDSPYSFECELGNGQIQQFDATWSEIFLAVAPSMGLGIRESRASSTIAYRVQADRGMHVRNLNQEGHVAGAFLEQIRIQLMALGLIRLDRSPDSMVPELYWFLTSQGELEMMRRLSVKETESGSEA